jgi:MFS superfamily sulfate permease-like transporter
VRRPARPGWVLPTLRGYRPSWLGADALAGLTLVAVVLPSQMATARLAGLSVVVGLYAFVAGALLYALIGTDRHLSVGADSTIAPVLAVGVGAVAAVGSSGYGSAMAFTAIVVGAILVGAGSVAAGLMGTLAVDASPPNTAIATASGTRSQLANVMAALVVVVVAVGLTAPLADLPQATLAATLVFVATKLFRVEELRTILSFDRLEFALAAVTILVVALVGIEQGVLLAMILSLADRTRRTLRPRDTLLGRDPGTDHWIPRDIGRPTEEVPGVLVYLV